MERLQALPAQTIGYGAHKCAADAAAGVGGVDVHLVKAGMLAKHAGERKAGWRAVGGDSDPQAALTLRALQVFERRDLLAQRGRQVGLGE